MITFNCLLIREVHFWTNPSLSPHLLGLDANNYIALLQVVSHWCLIQALQYCPLSSGIAAGCLLGGSHLFFSQILHGLFHFTTGPLLPCVLWLHPALSPALPFQLNCWFKAEIPISLHTILLPCTPFLLLHLWSQAYLPVQYCDFPWS